ncbi:MAG: hypothetical protein GY747_05185 [Planctomycetes bacterium]|nr:hypothetical protein [Planctomycetota bacterium]MCP4770919.1 hypothetical protein [Planctomycetota bacterium]MCP4862256.1 hypothetical protein [Planctomycetota bacterium]
MLSALNLPFAALLAGIAFLSPDLSAQTAPEDLGAHQAGWSAADFWDNINGRGHVRGRVYYPAASAGLDARPDYAGGPYPLIALNHGWFATPENYHQLSQHLASWGFIVSSIGTETGFFGSMIREAADSHAMMGWVETQSNTPSSPFYTLVDSDKLGAIGHSMGGGSLSYMMGLEPRIQTVVPMEGFIDGLGFDSQGLINLREFTGFYEPIHAKPSSNSCNSNGCCNTHHLCRGPRIRQLETKDCGGSWRASPHRDVA